VGPRAGLDIDATGKILCPRRESNPDRPVVQPVVRHYTPELTRLLNKLNVNINKLDENVRPVEVCCCSLTLPLTRSLIR
jgi:hypothetical protein